MKKKKIIATVSAIALAVIVTVGGGTLSLLTDQSEKITNTLNPKTLDIVLDEALVDEDGKEITGTGAQRVTTNTYNYVPGAVLDKDPTATIPQGSASCYVYLWLTNELGDAAELDIDSTKWIEVYTDSNGTLYQYYQVVDENTSDDTVLEPLFTTVTISKDLTADDLEKLGSADITVQAYAIQSENIDITEALSSAVSNFAGNGKTVIAVNTETGTVYTADQGLATAVKAAEAGETVKLYADISSTVEIDINKELTIDLNGFDYEVTGTTGYPFYIMSADAVSITNTSSNESIITGYRYAVGANTSIAADISISNVTLKTTSTGSDVFGVHVYCNDTTNYADSKLTIDNVKIDTTSSSSSQGIYSSVADLTVTNTTIDTAYQGIYSAGTAVIEGCTVTTDSTATYGYGIYNNGTMTISDTTVTSNSAAAVNSNKSTCVLTVEAGSKFTSTGSYGIRNLGSMTVTGGEITGTSSLYIGASSVSEISDGTFTGKFSKVNGASMTITGGTYTVDPSSYVDTTTYDVTYDSTAGTYTVTAK